MDTISIRVIIYPPSQSHNLCDIIQPGALLAVANLAYRGTDHTHNVPTATARDVTVFSQRPTHQHLVVAMEQLRIALPVSLWLCCMVCSSLQS